MNATLTSELDRLSDNEKFDVIEHLWLSIRTSELEVTDFQREILKERLEEFRRDPHEGQTLEEFMAANGLLP